MQCTWIYSDATTVRLPISYFSCTVEQKSIREAASWVRQASQRFHPHFHQFVSRCVEAWKGPAFQGLYAPGRMHLWYPALRSLPVLERRGLQGFRRGTPHYFLWVQAEKMMWRVGCLGWESKSTWAGFEDAGLPHPCGSTGSAPIAAPWLGSQLQYWIARSILPHTRVSRRCRLHWRISRSIGRKSA